jgi:hypothetical protein
LAVLDGCVGEFAIKQQGTRPITLSFITPAAAGPRCRRTNSSLRLLGKAWMSNGASVLKRDRKPGPKPEGGCRMRCHNDARPQARAPDVPENLRAGRRVTKTTSLRSCRRPARSIADAPPPMTATRVPASRVRSWWSKLCDAKRPRTLLNVSGTYRKGPTPTAMTTRPARACAPLSSSSRLLKNSFPPRFD